MNDKTLMPTSQDDPNPTFLFREDYLLFGLLVRHGLVEPEHYERLAVAQQQDNNKLSLLQLLSENSSLDAQQQKNIQELLDLLATPKLREKLPAELPEVHTLIAAAAMPTVHETLRAPTLPPDRHAGPQAASGDAPTLIASPDTLRSSASGVSRTLAATSWESMGSTLTDAEMTRIEKARAKGGLVGKGIAGHVILDRIGSGGQGDVYMAKQLSLNRYVALKKLEAPAHASPEAFIAAFRHEAQTLGQINHARIVKVYEIFQENDNIFFTMEYINGKTLKELIGDSGGPMPLDVVANLACQACSALARTAHDGLVHRDIKPANMLVDENGDLKIVDFGLAGVQAAFADHSTGFVGTPQYASPEQCRLEPLTAATDQYSLGVTLYHALTGDLPFKANKLRDLLEKHANEPVKPPSTINEHLSKAVDRVIVRMMEKNPANRFADFDELFGAWEQILHESARTNTTGARQLLGEGLLRLSRQDRDRLVRQSLVLVGLWLAMVLGVVLGETSLRSHGMAWVLDACGWLGTGMLTFSLSCIFYVALARKGWLPTIGSLRAWLYIHIVTAIPSVLMLMIHSGNFLRGFSPGPPQAKPILTLLISFVLIVTAVSGSVGLLIFRELRRYLQLQQMQLRGSEASARELMISVLSARLLSGWRLVHYPLAVFFILLTVLHIAVTVRFSGQ